MGAPTRSPYGTALGFQNQFSFTVGPTASGTAGNISGNATPNVTLGNLFYVNNTGSLVITSLLLDDTGNRLTQYEGKIIRIFCLDTGSTTISATAPSGSILNMGQNSNIDLMFSRGSWFLNDGANTFSTQTYITNAQSSINVNGVSLAFLNNTGGTTNSIIGLSGGVIGQEVSFALVGSNAVRFISGNMVMTQTNAVLINASGLYKAVKVLANEWRMVAINSGGAL